MRRALVVLAMSCGGSIAPVDTFNDPPIAAKPIPDGGPPSDSFAWQALELEIDNPKQVYSACAGGKTYVRPAQSYNVWVGVELCGSTRYKIYLSFSQTGPYHEIADLAGHGQDHCELVNPRFTIANEDQITSGQCKTCDLDGSTGNNARGRGESAFLRSRYGELFTYAVWPNNAYTAAWYECGVSIP